MNATELFHQDGKSTGIFYCAKCRNVARTQAEAEKCCAPTFCADCGKETERRSCDRCNNCYPAYRQKEDAKRRAKHLAGAALVKDYAGAVFWDGTPGDVARASSYFSSGDNDGFFIDMDDLLNAIEEADEPVDRPEFVFCCTERPFHLNLSSAIESACDDMHEGAMDDIDGVEELQVAVDAFNERNKGVVSYGPDFSRKVRVPMVGREAMEEM